MAYGGNLFDKGGKKKSKGSSATGTMSFIEQELIKRGVPPVQAKAVAANVMVESSGNPGAVNSVSGAKGLVQLLGDRKRGIKSWSMEDQLDYIAAKYNKLGGNEWLNKAAWRRFNQTDDPVEAARLFRRYWERPEASSWYDTDKYFGKSYLPRETNNMVQQLSNITWDDVQTRRKRFELTPEEEALLNSTPNTMFNVNYTDWDNPSNSKTFEEAYAPFALDESLYKQDNLVDAWNRYTALQNLGSSSSQESDPLSFVLNLSAISPKATSDKQTMDAMDQFLAVTSGGFDGINFAAYGGKVNKFGEGDELNRTPYIRNYHWGTMPETEKQYIDWRTGQPINPGDPVWANEQNELVTANMPWAEQDYEVQNGNPVFSLNLDPVTILGEPGKRGKTGAYIGESFDKGYARLRNLPTAPQLNLSYEQQLPHQYSYELSDKWLDNQKQYIKNKKFGHQLDLAALGALFAPVLGIAGAEALPFLAPGTVGGTLIGETAGGMAMGELLNKGTEMLTGRNWGDNVRNTLENTFGYNPESWSSFGQGAYNFATDMTNPGYWNGSKWLKSGINAGEQLLNKAKTLYDNGALWDKYTTFGGRFGYYGDTPMNRFTGTIQRRFNIGTPKASKPELLRKIGQPIMQQSDG